MALSKEYLREKVKQAIKQMPSAGYVVREVLNNYNEKAGYCIVGELEGIFYSKSTTRNLGITIDNAGINIEQADKNYLVDFNDISKNIRTTDFIFIDNKCYKIIDPGENLEVYCLIQLNKHHLIKNQDTIIDNDEIYPLMELPLDLDLRVV